MPSCIMLVKSLVIANISSALPCESVFENYNQSLLWALKSPSTMTSNVAWFVFSFLHRLGEIIEKFGKRVIIRGAIDNAEAYG